MTIMTFISFCSLSLALVTDVEQSCHDLNEILIAKKKTSKIRVESKAKLIEIIQCHADAKQLSFFRMKLNCWSQ